MPLPIEQTEREIEGVVYCIIKGDYGEVATAAESYFNKFDVRLFETQRISTHRLAGDNYEMVIRRLKDAKQTAVKAA